ncbi:unnamed protein product [Pseudo-nitzschia multistriata]|uniref:Uncharacterized protein n=1 Tax=Pseudo-nitzschia multistriata TaxID=183589 RepID=A0A448YUN2_9STRA|nr:unnamed protein product [Pseudo-nitzschia multistriata]
MPLIRRGPNKPLSIDSRTDVENPSGASPAGTYSSTGTKRPGRISSLTLLKWQEILQQWLQNVVQKFGLNCRLSVFLLFFSCVVAMGIAIAVLTNMLVIGPPGKNYFSPSYWRRTHSLSTQQLLDLRHRFPIRVDINNTEHTESIIHPGYLLTDKDRMQELLQAEFELVNMTVPKFWDPVCAFGQFDGGVREFLGNGGKYLITPTEASAIGSFYEGERTIFIAIASYRDPECSLTVEDIFARAKHPERLRVAIADQRKVDGNDPSCRPPGEDSCREAPDQTLCPYADRIDYIEYPSILMVGPVFARHLVNRMYRGEYFAMQVDSHVRFVANWDEDLIDQWDSTGNEMAVLTNYMTDLGRHSIDPVTHESAGNRRSLMCKFDYEWNPGSMAHIKFGEQPVKAPTVEDSPMLQPFWAAGFSFGRGHFVVSVPYDHYLPSVFQGEEILQTIRGFSFGYDYYAPLRNVAYHMYAVRFNWKKRNEVPKFTENQAIFGRAVKEQAYHRLIGISGTSDPAPDYLHLEEERYGLGRIRSREQFFNTFGIHPETMKIEEDLCSFVDSMHTKFKPFLRYDKMGIDYSRITYQHKTPVRNPIQIDEEELLRLQAKLREQIKPLDKEAY